MIGARPKVKAHTRRGGLRNPETAASSERQNGTENCLGEVIWSESEVRRCTEMFRRLHDRYLPGVGDRPERS